MPESGKNEATLILMSSNIAQALTPQQLRLNRKYESALCLQQSCR